MPDFPHNIRIRLEKSFFLLRPDVALSLPCWLSQLRKAKLRQPTGQRQSNIKKQQKKQLGQSCSYIMRKVWCHQIWIQTIFMFHCVRPNVHPMSASYPLHVQPLSVPCQSNVHAMLPNVQAMSAKCPTNVRLISTLCPPPTHFISNLCPTVVHPMSA
jgi:hypothetical protein